MRCFSKLFEFELLVEGGDLWLTNQRDSSAYVQIVKSLRFEMQFMGSYRLVMPMETAGAQKSMAFEEHSNGSGPGDNCTKEAAELAHRCLSF